jgi:hypothetical protein
MDRDRSEIMEPCIQPNELNNWRRVGGHRLDFYATEADFQRWLLSGLPPGLAPYRIVGEGVTREERGHIVQLELEQWLAALTSAGKTLQQWFIWPHRFMPDLPISAGVWDYRLLLFNGLPQLTISGPLPRRDTSSLVITDRVQSELDGAVRQNIELLRLFQRLCRVIRKDLIYTTLRIVADGTEHEVSDRMTEAAHQEYSAGAAYAAKPGRRHTDG